MKFEFIFSAPLMDQLKARQQIPALCFNDDRDICESLAVRLFNELQQRESDYTLSAEFRHKYNFKAEDVTTIFINLIDIVLFQKAIKLAKRKRDEEERQARKKKEKKKDEDGNVERYEKDTDLHDTGIDQIALQRAKLMEDLERLKYIINHTLLILCRFKYFGRWSDMELFNRVVENLQKISYRQSAQKLLKLFERGIGFHHDGLNNRERSAVEVLFRQGFLGVVFSTSTLALGY
jgi:replicative superfamily II helicase